MNDLAERLNLIRRVTNSIEKSVNHGAIEDDMLLVSSYITCNHQHEEVGSALHVLVLNDSTQGMIKQRLREFCLSDMDDAETAKARKILVEKAHDHGTVSGLIGGLDTEGVVEDILSVLYEAVNLNRPVDSAEHQLLLLISHDCGNPKCTIMVSKGFDKSEAIPALQEAQAQLILDMEEK